MRQDEGNKLFLETSSPLRVHWLGHLHAQSQSTQTHTHRERGSTNQAGAMQLQLTNATTTFLAKKRPIPSSKTNFGTALFIVYCCHSRETEMATEVEAETPTETRLPAVHRSLMYLYLPLPIPVDLPVALFFWSHCCCNLVTLCFIFITHTKLLHIKKVKFSVSFFPLPLLYCCFALIAPRLSFQQKLHEMGLV